MTSPKITDDMVEHALAVWPRFPVCTVSQAQAALRRALEAALDRRVGPKCRRVEVDDVSPARPTRRHHGCKGRRSTEKDYWYELPRKSARLARESAEKAKEEIEVSEGMRKAGADEVRRLHATNRAAMSRGAQVDVYSIETYDAELIWRAMERVRREESRAAPCGASDARQGACDASAAMTTGRVVDPWTWHDAARPHGRAGELPSFLHRRKDDR